MPPLFEIAGAAMPLVGCSGLLPSLLPNWSEEVQILAQIANLIVNFWALYFGRLSMKLKNLEVFVRYRSKMTILDEIYLSQIRMTACTTFTDAVLTLEDAIIRKPISAPDCVLPKQKKAWPGRVQHSLVGGGRRSLNYDWMKFCPQSQLQIHIDDSKTFETFDVRDHGA